ncbi:MAG TPA: ATPase, T2SS/T4P/T4SS family [Longimicrobiales bacterium]|nr:ATPase, T2SS/T4P/T4SS family [Longimicrobiales bacterium]
MSTTPPSSPPRPDQRSPGEPKILGQLLLARSAIGEPELEAALRAQGDAGRRLGEILVERGACGEEAVARALAEQLALPFAPAPLEPDPAAWELLRPELARARRVVPLRASPRTLRLAMADPLDLDTVDDVRFQCGRRVEPAVATPGSVARALSRRVDGDLSLLLDEIPGSREEESSDELERAARSTPIVRLVDHLLEEAVRSGASDIHLERRSGDLRVRLRIDGILRTAVKLPRAGHASVVSRLKIMAGLDISVKRRPQDGSFRLARGDDALTVRLSTLPVTGGEKAVLRILDPARAPRDLGALGLAPEELERLRRLIGAGQGVVLAAGPTGSGKSSTLFAAMAELDREVLNVVTLEDPVEYRLEGASQVQVNPRSGLSFPAALRSVLRQDPDVVMVGEIRDRETAEIAMAAAVTGHLVLSTIHTTDAPGAVTRLLNMGVPPYLVAGGLVGVVAQRLVRRLCPSCRGRPASACGECPDGYRGRTGVFQLLVASDALRDQVIRGSGTEALRKLARAAGMGSLVEDVRRKVVEGITTPHEAGRVIQADPGASLPCPACGFDVPSGALGCPRCGAPRLRRCPCGEELRRGWRFCAWCLRPVRS